MKTSRANDLPMIDCPVCEKKFQYDAYCDIDVGSEIDCPLCDSVMVVDFVDTRILIDVVEKAPE